MVITMMEDLDSTMDMIMIVDIGDLIQGLEVTVDREATEDSPLRSKTKAPM